MAPWMQWRFVYWEIPMVTAAVQVRIPAASTEVRVAKAILVVEDEAFVSRVTCDVLSRQGYSVLWARNASEARKIFLRHSGQIALILCDAVLPDGNGMALAQDFSRETPGLKLIIASGYPPALLANGDAEAGMFLAKPYSSATLMEAVRNVMGDERAS